MKAFRSEDLKVDSLSEFFSFCLAAPFVVLISPFLMAAYTLGFCMNLVGWLDS